MKDASLEARLAAVAAVEDRCIDALRMLGNPVDATCQQAPVVVLTMENGMRLADAADKCVALLAREKAAKIDIEQLRDWLDIALNISPNTVRMEPWPAHTHDGMHVGMPSGVKITHLPTGIEVCDDSQRSQHKSREAALHKLRGALIERILEGRK